ncbi:MAG: hypothetical protein A2Z09_06595 [Nitrospirae bacterium RBG_16_43_8]|nr:MAG: hypothetical protein A2Z09_06595 [Nitrospirae bacterium RBG_16_43_8]
MKNAELNKKLCENFCSYYKPSKDSELACMGFIVTERLVKSGKKIPFDKSEQGSDIAVGEKLILNMCASCAFYESDCDFILKEGNALPCGGFILLESLLSKRIVTIDDIKNII